MIAKASRFLVSVWVAELSRMTVRILETLSEVERDE